MKRILNCNSSDFKKMRGNDLLESITASEGRVIISEVMASASPLYPDITNAELACAFGADFILLNLFDVYYPEIKGLSIDDPSDLITTLKQFIGRPIGINLEPVDTNFALHSDNLSKGRIANHDTLIQAKSLGFDFVCLTGNPNSGVSNSSMINTVKLAKEVFSDGFVIAGKMHAAGVKEESGSDIVSQTLINQLIENGADVILLPAAGTVPGITVDTLHPYINYIHQHQRLALLTIGTSQEGADEQTIRTIALNNKMAGADMHHIGDTGFYGIAVPENIMEYSIAIRGRRHTYIRMAKSTHR